MADTVVADMEKLQEDGWFVYAMSLVPGQPHNATMVVVYRKEE